MKDRLRIDKAKDWMLYLLETCPGLSSPGRSDMACFLRWFWRGG